MIATISVKKNHYHTHILRNQGFRGQLYFLMYRTLKENTLFRIVKIIGNHQHYLKVCGRGGLKFYRYFIVSFKKNWTEDLHVLFTCNEIVSSNYDFYHIFCARYFSAIPQILTFFSQMIASGYSSRRFLNFCCPHFRYQFFCYFCNFFRPIFADKNSETIRDMNMTCSGQVHVELQFDVTVQLFDASGAIYWSSPGHKNWVRILRSVFLP